MLQVTSPRKRLFGNGLLISTMLLLVLAGCERDSATEPMALTSQTESLEMTAPGCASPDDCASVMISRQVFADRPALNDAVYEQLLQQLQGNGESGDTPLDSLDKVAQKFIEDAATDSEISAARWQLNGNVKTLARRGNLLTLATSTYLYTGGAHGMPVTRWLNWDLAKDSRVTLGDVIVPGQEKNFWKMAEEAHRQWLDTQNAREDFRQNWPFAQTDDFRLTEKGLILFYGVYTLGPYSMGEVELTIPREKLAGVIREPYLPDTGNHSD